MLVQFLIEYENEVFSLEFLNTDSIISIETTKGLEQGVIVTKYLIKSDECGKAVFRTAVDIPDLITNKNKFREFSPRLKTITGYSTEELKRGYDDWRINDEDEFKILKFNTVCNDDGLITLFIIYDRVL